MHLAIPCVDEPDSLELRLATRPRHLAHPAANIARPVLVGPVLDGEGKPRGSRSAVDVAAPHARAGLFDSLAIRPLRVVFKDGRQVAG